MAARLLVTAAVLVSTASAYLELAFTGCGCGTAIPTYDRTTSAYCPTSSYRTCDINLLKQSACTIYCDGPRSQLVFRNRTNSYFTPAKSVKCVKDDWYYTDENIRNTPNKPTCALKEVCDMCPDVEYQPNCPEGMSCKPARLVPSTDENGCKRISCTEGQMMVYNSSGAPIDYMGKELYCLVNNRWSNFSRDGETSAGTQILETFTANCALPLACEKCIKPKEATALSQIPAQFRTDYVLVPGNFSKEEGHCNTFSCPSGVLYGFSGTATNVTGLEYTSTGSMICGSSSYWLNNYLGATPANLIAACLAPKPSPTTPPPTTTMPPTTPWACGAFDPLELGGGSIECKDGQARVKCPDGKKIKILTNDATLTFAQMSFIPGKGWLSFDCDGFGKMWKTGSSGIVGSYCEGFM